MKHTKGNWTTSKSVNGQFSIDAKKFDSEVPVTVATTMSQQYIDAEEREANAKLIAAAPRMLEALKTILTIHRNDLVGVAKNMAESVIKEVES